MWAFWPSTSRKAYALDGLDIMLPHFCVALTPHGSVALIGIEGKLPWDGEIRQVIKRCSTNPCYQLVDVLAQWQARKMFEKRGENRHCSGLVERAVASMINQRLKKRGLHWKRANINAVVALRVQHPQISADWEAVT